MHILPVSLEVIIELTLGHACVELTEKADGFLDSHLEKARKLDHSPAESGHIRLYQAHLVNIHSQEALNHAAVLGDDCACDEVAVI